jgi:hypothetical protein
MARKRRFENRWLESLRPLSSGRRELFWDMAQPGLCVRHSRKIAFYVVSGQRARSNSSGATSATIRQCSSPRLARQHA